MPAEEWQRMPRPRAVYIRRKEAECISNTRYCKGSRRSDRVKCSPEEWAELTRLLFHAAGDAPIHARTVLSLGNLVACCNRLYAVKTSRLFSSQVALKTYTQVP